MHCAANSLTSTEKASQEKVGFDTKMIVEVEGQCIVTLVCHGPALTVALEWFRLVRFAEW